MKAFDGAVRGMLEHMGCASVEQIAQAVPGEPGESLRVRERRVRAALKALGARSRVVGGIPRAPLHRSGKVVGYFPACPASTLWSLKPWRSQRVCRTDRPIAAPAVGKASSEGGSAAR